MRRIVTRISPAIWEPATSLNQNWFFPAGVAGEPINLALTDPSADHLGAVTFTVAGIPSGWSLSEGTDNGNGTWTVQTSNPRSLTITTAAGFAGASLLTVSETWTNADGSTGFATIKDNVEAYAPGSPIFAWSGDDTLTGSSGNDEFVFAQPIGNDTIYNFDVAADQIDLIGFGGIAGFADIQAHTANDDRRQRGDHPGRRRVDHGGGCRRSVANRKQFRAQSGAGDRIMPGP